MRIISSIQTAALVVARAVTACSPRAESRDRILDAVHAGADLERRQS